MKQLCLFEIIEEEEFVREVSLFIITTIIIIILLYAIDLPSFPRIEISWIREYTYKTVRFVAATRSIGLGSLVTLETIYEATSPRHRLTLNTGTLNLNSALSS